MTEQEQAAHGRTGGCQSLQLAAQAILQERHQLMVGDTRLQGEQFCSRDILTYLGCDNMSISMIERTTVRLPQDLLRRAKRKAAAQGRTLTALIEDGLRLVVKDRGSVERKRVLPRVSRAAGGVMPGTDFTNLSALQELDDQAYVKRMNRAE
jgi:hypothetical protein